jgi:hypothetical protein
VAVSLTPDATALATSSDTTPDAECAGAVELARAAAIEMSEGPVGAHLGVQADEAYVVTHAFAAELPGYIGWHWAVTVGRVAGFAPTVDEVVLLPGEGALLAPVWVPWHERVQPGDLSPGDLLPPAPDDPRLVPAYLDSDDPQYSDVAFELGIGRVQVLSRFGRLDAADRWQAGDGGPESPMAKQAPAHCGTCAFLLPLPGSLRAGFGVCANEHTDTDGRVVTVDHGCGAHSEAVIEPEHIDAGEIYDDAELDLLEIVPDAVESVADVEPVTDVEPIAAETVAAETVDIAEIVEVEPDAPSAE